MKKCTLVFPVRAGAIWLARKKRKVGSGLFNGWGGKLERGEGLHPELGAAREFQQETGAKVSLSELEHVGTIRFYEAGMAVFDCWIYFLYSWEGVIKESDEMGQPEAFSLDEVPYGEMMPGDKEWLPLLLQGERLKGKCWYSAGNTRLLNFSHRPL